MKKLSLIAALALGGLLACSTIAMAQDTNATPKKGGKRGMPTVEQRLDRMTTELSLTDEQKPKVKAVLEETGKDMQALRDLPQDERRPKMQSIREDETKKLKAILTPDQMDKLSKMQEKRGKKKADQ
jgi:Spy/CpxP family protein refolding chaperone